MIGVEFELNEVSAVAIAPVAKSMSYIPSGVDVLLSNSRWNSVVGASNGSEDTATLPFHPMIKSKGVVAAVVGVWVNEPPTALDATKDENRSGDPGRPYPSPPKSMVIE